MPQTPPTGRPSGCACAQARFHERPGGHCGHFAGLAISSAAYAATSSPAAPAGTSVPRCAAALGQVGNVSVLVAVDQGSGTAGATYYPLEFTNTSGHAWPGQRSASYAAFGFEACSHPGVAYLSIAEPIPPESHDQRLTTR
jgi:hypothetical protein